MPPIPVFETPDFTLTASNPPHVSRTDGGHMVIRPKEPVVHRWEFDIRRAKELMRLTMLAGEAMLNALNEQGIPVERLNFQDNGNWAIGSDHGPRFHLHLYGRSRDSVGQVHGEALSFPAKATGWWKDNEPLSEQDIVCIRSWIQRLEGEERYRPENW